MAARKPAAKKTAARKPAAKKGTGKKAPTREPARAPHTDKAMGAEWQAVMDRVRSLCMALPETQEFLSWGHPTWKVGKGAKARMFAGFGAEEGFASLGIRADPFEKPVLLKNPDISVHKYAGNKGWLTLRITRPEKVDWKLVAHLLEVSHAVISGKMPG